MLGIGGSRGSIAFDAENCLFLYPWRDNRQNLDHRGKGANPRDGDMTSFTEDVEMSAARQDSAPPFSCLQATADTGVDPQLHALQT